MGGSSKWTGLAHSTGRDQGEERRMGRIRGHLTLVKDEAYPGSQYILVPEAEMTQKLLLDKPCTSPFSLTLDQVQ
jgi:hypothetical protein